MCIVKVEILSAKHVPAPFELFVEQWCVRSGLAAEWWLWMRTEDSCSWFVKVIRWCRPQRWFVVAVNVPVSPREVVDARRPKTVPR